MPWSPHLFQIFLFIYMRTSVQIYLPHLRIQATGISILFHYIKDRSYTCLTEQLGNFQFISCNTALHFPIPQKGPTCCSAADVALQAFLFSPSSALEALAVATSWQEELCKTQEKELCKTQEILSALPNSYFREAAETISRSVFKTQQWNSLELPVHISHSQKHTHV